MSLHGGSVSDEGGSGGSNGGDSSGSRCCEYTDIFPFSSLLSIVSITFLISLRSIYLKHTI